MSFYNCVIRLCCLFVCIAIILVSPYAANAKSTANSGAVFNLSDFGAVGDGVADDGPAFQEALDAIAEAGGGTLFVPAGSYLVATPVVKDFSGPGNITVNIQGVPSNTMPAPPTALGNELGAGLNLTSEIIPATGDKQHAFILKNLHQLDIEHISFSGRPEASTDAVVTLYLIGIDKATIRHCEFYGLSSMTGNMIRADQSELLIDVSVFLGCTANSGVYAPVVENIDWRKFTITNSIFLDYGNRAFFGKTGLGAPLSWINLGRAAATTPESPRREIVVRNTFLDEGGWIGLTVLPNRWGPEIAPIDLIYISGLKMNVSNLLTTGHALYDAKNVLIENSHYGWSHNATAALTIGRIDNAIFDNLTCIDHADRLYAEPGTGRLAVINSKYRELDSHAQITTAFDTPPEKDPVQLVRQMFISTLGRQPDPAAHFYWSDILIKCNQDNDCLNQRLSELSEFLGDDPQPDFSLSGAVTDENGDPLSGVAVSLSGSQSTAALTDSQGRFRFSSLPTSGSYTVAVNKRHYTFTTSSQTFVRPHADVTVDFSGDLNRHSISGRITRPNGTGVSGVRVKIAQLPTTQVTTDANGLYSFHELLAGGNYTIYPSSSNDVGIAPLTITLNDLSADREANFVARLRPELLTIVGSEMAVAFDAVNFLVGPFSIFDFLGFSPDGITRVIVFAKNLDDVSSLSQVSVVAQDDEGATYPLEIEHMSNLAVQNELKQLNLRLSPNFRTGDCLQLRVSVAGVNSNHNARICIADADAGK